MTPPYRLDRYHYDRLQEAFARKFHEDYSLSDPRVAVTGSTLTDLDNDGERDDDAGTAILQIGSRVRGFIFLMREDGETRFLENDGRPFDPNREFRVVPCMETRPWHCPSTLDRARHFLRPARISTGEHDSQRPGLELAIYRGEGRWSLVNSLEAFLR